MNMLCKFICKADVALRPLAYAQLQKWYDRVMQHFVISDNHSEFNLEIKLNATNKDNIFYILYTKSTSTDQQSLILFLAVSKVNKASLAILPSLLKYTHFCQ